MIIHLLRLSAGLRASREAKPDGLVHTEARDARVKGDAMQPDSIHAKTPGLVKGDSKFTVAMYSSHLCVRRGYDIARLLYKRGLLQAECKLNAS